MKKLIVVFICFVFTNGFSQSAISIPANFVKESPPKVWSDDWYKLNNSSNAFSVKIIDNKLEVEKVVPATLTSKVKDDEVVLPTGILKGTDGGEFGGSLMFYPKDTSKTAIKISRGNFKKIFRLDNKIYALAGTAHMGLDMGGMLQIDRGMPGIDTADNNFVIKNVINFYDSPEAYSIHNDSLFIATFKGFFVVKDLKKSAIFTDMFWEALYPDSVAVLNAENIFVGIRGGFVKLNIVNKSFEFYKNIK